jgi:2,3-dihydroxy-2,3-dihydrophenylpropionate dehydrogenase
MKSLEGNVVLVVGGGSGIGRAVVDLFLEEGAHLGVLEIDPQKAKDLAKLGPSVFPVPGDATKLEDNEFAVSETISKYGKIDALVCCAGIFDSFISLLDFPKEKLAASFGEIFDVNVKSFILSTKAALHELIRTQGSIVYTVSHAGFFPGGGGVLYTGTKFAVRGLVLEMAHELAPKVRVNGVAPGGTPTDLRGLRSLNLQNQSLASQPNLEDHLRKGSPLQTVCYPRDHAWAYLYLVSREMSRIVTGTIMHTDGGTFARGLTKLAGLIPS